jgi:ABC-2 type transport system permease protein
LLWVRSLSRALVTADTSARSAQVRGAKLPLARAGLRGAVAARYWLYQRREPMSLVFWAMIAVITAAVSASSVFGHNRHPGVIIASAVFGAAFVGIFHVNSAGLTGPAFYLEATALGRSRDLRAYFSGQNLVLALIGAPLVIAVCFALAAAAGHQGTGIEAAPVVLAALGAALGLSNLFSVVLPYPMAKRAGSPIPVAAPGYGAYRIGSYLGTLAGTAIAAAPAIAAAVLAASDSLAVRLGVLLPACALYGFLLALAGVRLASALAAGKLPELCQVAISSAVT